MFLQVQKEIHGKLIAKQKIFLIPSTLVGQVILSVRSVIPWAPAENSISRMYN